MIEWADWHLDPRRRQCSYCPHWAAALLDGELVCLDCADALLERLEAVHLVPAFRSELPSFTDRVPGI